MDWFSNHKIEVFSLLLAVFPHIVALSPTLAKGEGIITAILNFLAGNYGAAENKKDDKKKGK